jgi:cytidylate kinase
MRAIAAKRGISLLELQELAESDPSIDTQVDDMNKEMGTHSNIIIDARLAWYFIPESFKVFLHLPEEIATERIWHDLSKNPARTGETALSPEDVLRDIRKRMSSNKNRYQNLYQIDYLDPNNFDLSIDTSRHNLEQVVNLIKEGYHNWITK